jgi:acyl-CoA thioesterase I
VSDLARVLFAAALLAALSAAQSPPGYAGPADSAATCTASAAGLDAPLEHSAGLIDSGRSPLILAIGSSSTLGIGASAPGLSYPSRLERDLADKFPKLAIRVVNHGVGGQDANQELARLDYDLSALHPDLVIWQVGTNALLRGYDLETERHLIERGVALAKGRGVDVVLMDLQYAPRVLVRGLWADMERLIADAAKREHIGLFRRFDIMREWSQSGRLSAAALIGRDGLHMTDASYGCLAATLAQSLEWAWEPQQPGRSAPSPHLHAAAMAGAHTLAISP